jgi:hypothetical protein
MSGADVTRKTPLLDIPCQPVYVQNCHGIY